MKEQSLKSFLAEQYAALRTLDINWARKIGPYAASDEVLLIALHKARYHCIAIDDAMRSKSAEWLRSHGASHGIDLLPPGQLPK